MTEFERLTELLLTDDRLALKKLDQKLDRSIESLPEQLPDIIRAASVDERLARAFEKPMADSLERVAQQRKEVLISVLFPLIGPLIRRSISESISLLLRDLNRALDHSFSPTGLRWRFEALRSGVPFSSVVLKHTLRYRVEHLLLVRNEGGMLIAKASNKDAQMADSDAVAAMLSALQDFARDAVNAGKDDALSTINFGDLTLSILRGPLAHLAIAVRGELSTDSMESLISLVEQAHVGLDVQLFGDQPRFEVLQNKQNEQLSDWLFKRGQLSSSAEEQVKQKKPWVALLLAAAIFTALLAWISLQIWHGQRAQHLQERLNQLPGYFVQVKFQRGLYVVSGARDPESTPLNRAASALGFVDKSVRSELQPYLALDPGLWIPRLRRMVDLPANVTIEKDATGLTLSGTVNLSERRALRSALAGLPYLPVDLSKLVVQDSIAARELIDLHRNIQTMRVQFEGQLPTAEGELALEKMQESLRQVLARAEGAVSLMLVEVAPVAQMELAAAPRAALIAAKLKAQLPSLQITVAARAGAKQESGYVAISQLRY